MMKNVKTILLSVAASGIFFGFVGCSSTSGENLPVETGLTDVTGVYRTDANISNISSVTSIEIVNGQSEADLSARVLRNGLSDPELTYLNSINAVQWADSRFGRNVDLNNLKEGSKVKIRSIGGTTFVDVCGDKIAFDSRSMDFQYCLSFERDTDSLIAEGELLLNVFEFGSKINTIVTPYRLFTKDRWFLDYFGDWSGELQYSSGNTRGLRLGSGQRLDLTFQPVTETQYILRPFDTAQSITFDGEAYVLFPQTRLLSELEGNANPYINFIYVSSVDGAKVLNFNSFVRSDGGIEGVVEYRFNGQNPVTIATYQLQQVR